MIVLEFKIKGKQHQLERIDEAIRTGQFIRNKCLRFWMDNQKINRYDLNKHCAVLAHEFKFADNLNSMARQSHAERAWIAISRFYANCRSGAPGKKGYPNFKHNSQSVEYKTSGWKLGESRRYINFKDGQEIGRLKLIGTRDLNFYPIEQIKRVRLIRRADGYYCQFCISIDVVEDVTPTQSAVGLDVGLNFFYTDSTGRQEENPRFYRQAEKRLKRLQRRVSKKLKKPKKNRVLPGEASLARFGGQKILPADSRHRQTLEGDKQSNNYKKAKQKLAKKHLKVSRQRIEHAKRLARCVVKSNDFVAYEDLQIRNMVKTHCLAKSITDAGWYQFRLWLEYFGQKFGKATVAVSPHYTSQECSSCGIAVKKSLSTRTHICKCGCVLDRDENAALNILKKGLSTVGHTGTWALSPNAGGDETSTQVGVNLLGQVLSLNQESPCL